MVRMIAGILLGFALHVGAAQAQSAAVDCGDAARRAIGYWIGEWIVSDTASSTPIAESRIEWVVDGCAIRESYEQKTGPGGKPMHYAGTSYTAYDAASDRWKQFYVDTTGRAALLDGDLRDKRLVLNGKTGAKLTRMTIEALADGDVRQHGEASADGGKHWAPTFDFTYRKK